MHYPTPLRNASEWFAGIIGHSSSSTHCSCHAMDKSRKSLLVKLRRRGRLLPCKHQIKVQDALLRSLTNTRPSFSMPNLLHPSSSFFTRSAFTVYICIFERFNLCSTHPSIPAFVCFTFFFFQFLDNFRDLAYIISSPTASLVSYFSFIII